MAKAKARKMTMTIDRELLKERLEGFVAETLPGNHKLESFTVHRSGSVQLNIKIDEDDDQPDLSGVGETEKPGSSVLE